MNLFKQTWLKIRSLWHRNDTKLEIDEELRFHIERRAAENIAAGMTPEEAAREARKQFGNLQSVREECRETRGASIGEDTWRDLRFASRQLVRDPTFTAVAVLTLALGIGVNTALFSIINTVMLTPLPFRESGRLVALWESSPSLGIEQEAVSPPTFADWKAQSSVFEEIAYWTGPMDFNMVAHDGAEKVRASYPSSRLFRALEVKPQLGRIFEDEDDRKEGPSVAMISDKLWRDRFDGDPKVLRRTLALDSYGRRTYTIIGVMPPGFHFPEDTELWLAAGWNNLPQDRRDGHWMDVLARLKPGISHSQAQAQMNTIQARLRRQYSNIRMGTAVSIVPLLRQTVGRNTRAALLILWSVVAGVLLIACVNVANLMLARTASRHNELALRLALGAGRGRVMRQLLTESVLLALLGGTMGIIFGYAGMKWFIAVNPANIPRLQETSLDVTALCFTLGISVLTGLLFGLAPAWHALRPDLNTALKQGDRGTSGSVAHRRLRASLVVAEVALATVLLAGAGLMLQSLARLLSIDRGFQAEHVLTAQLDFSVSGFTGWVEPTATRPQVAIKELLEHIRQIPGVKSAGVAFRFFRSDNHPPVMTFTVYGRPALPDNERLTADFNAITPGCLQALQARLLRGRDFTEADTLVAPGVALVNESFVRRYFPNEDPIGRHVTMASSPGALDERDARGLPVWSEIVGVVSDMKSLSLQPEATPEIFRPYWQWPMYTPTLFVRGTGDATQLITAIRQEIKSVIPNLPTPDFRLLTERVGESVAQPRFQASLLSLFGALALLLAAYGIYGVLAYTVVQRKREIGIRMALGAQRRDVMRMVVGEGLKMAAAGVGIGIAAALLLCRVLASLMFGVAATDPFIFALIAGILIGVACLASFLPAHRATRIDPMNALRHE